MARPSTLLIFYRLLFAAIFPIVALHAAWAAFRQRDFRYLRERLGFPGPAITKAPLWVHAASVGEVNAVIPLIMELRRRFPCLSLVVTTGTITGAATVRTKLPDEIEHRFLPLDRVGGVNRFLKRIAPSGAIIVETELWPNLYHGCAEHGVPLLIVNGRVSRRTLRAPQWLRLLYAESLAKTRAILARSAEDKEGFIRLGAPAERVEVIGNIKFASAPLKNQVKSMELGRPFVVAVSTRDDEEILVVLAWEQAAVFSHLLVITPRHPQRLPMILKQLGKRRVAVRSRGDAIALDTEIYIADTFGELPGFIAGSTVVIMGGSFVPKGGQNLLEPAALGKPIIAGPHMENFSVETQILLEAEAMMQVQLSDLAQILRALLKDEKARSLLGNNAQAAVESRRGVAIRYADSVVRLLGLR